MTMATNAVKTPIFKAMTRNYVQKIQPITGQIKEVKTSALPNKLVVASSDNGSPITRLSVVFRAGSRYETPDNQGAAHVLRIAAGLSTKKCTHFAIVRNLQQVGATLTCTTDRETIAYTLAGTYEAVERSSEYLNDIVCEQVFKPWELSDAMPRLKLELASLSPEVRAINFLHRAAYRTGLGNSLFCAKHNVGKLSSETLQHYVAENFTTNRAAVVGLGISHDILLKYAQGMTLESGTAKDNISKYYGGEIRSEKGGDLAYVAIAGEGGSLSTQQDILSFAVLQRVFGVGSPVKRGAQNCSLLSKAICAGDKNVAVSAINVAYSDSGLFGALLAGSAKDVGAAVSAVAETIKCASFNDEDVERAKTQLKAAILLETESASKYIDYMGAQAVLTGKVATPDDIANAIDCICTADVKRAAGRVAASPLSIASVGNLSSVPYLDELK